MRSGKSGARSVSAIVSVSPAARTPDTWRAARARYAATPTMSDASASAGVLRPSRGESARSIEYLNVRAVTGSFDGGEKRNPGLMPNV